MGKFIQKIPPIPLPGMVGKQKNSGREWRQDKRVLGKEKARDDHKQVQGKKKASVGLP